MVDPIVCSEVNSFSSTELTMTFEFCMKSTRRMSVTFISKAEPENPPRGLFISSVLRTYTSETTLAFCLFTYLFIFERE